MNKNRQPDAFLSYARLDDRVSDGYITWLREELESQVNASIGKGSFWIYQDVGEIGAGDNWKSSLETALSGARFFIPMMSPSFFVSQMCLFELAKFHGFENTSGRSVLIIPVYFRDAPDHWDDAENPHAALLRERQVFDFRRLRLRRRDDPEVVESIERLANDIKKALRRTLELARSTARATVLTTQPEAFIALQDELAATRKALIDTRSEVESQRSEFDQKLADIIRQTNEHTSALEKKKSTAEDLIQSLTKENNLLREGLDTTNAARNSLISEISTLKDKLAVLCQDNDKKQLNTSTPPNQSASIDSNLSAFSDNIQDSQTPFHENSREEAAVYDSTYHIRQSHNMLHPIGGAKQINSSGKPNKRSIVYFLKYCNDCPQRGDMLVFGIAISIIISILIGVNIR